MQHLCDVSQARKDRLVEAALGEIPSGLDATHTRMLYQIDNQKPYTRALAVKAFAWLFYAKEPLQMEALQVAIAIDAQCRSTTDLELDECSPRSVRKHCCTRSDIIRPLHYSVQEVFMQRSLGSLQGRYLGEVRNPDTWTCMSKPSVEVKVFA